MGRKLLALVGRPRPFPMRQKTLPGLGRRPFPDAQALGLTDHLGKPRLEGCQGAVQPRAGDPSPEQVAELEQELKAQGKTYEFHSYEGAGHAFFSVNRPAYRVEAANDGWEKILAFYGTYLS
jgi:acetyl esterase/lipase